MRSLSEVVLNGNSVVRSCTDVQLLSQLKSEVEQSFGKFQESCQEIVNLKGKVDEDDVAHVNDSQF